MAIKLTKIYNDKNVYDAAVERFEYIFDNFDAVSLSFSGGKDSSTMLQIAHEVAKTRNKKFTVLYVDLEAMMSHTVKHVEEVKEKIKSTVENFYWVCLPMVEENATSALQPEFITWDESEKSKWVREMPVDSININNNIFDFYHLTSIEEFVVEYAEWFRRKNKNKDVAIGVGIRANESLNRLKAVTKDTLTNTYKGNIWTTKISDGVYNVYPLYDWKTEDIWVAMVQKNFLYNEAYELMNKMGTPIHNQRICQPIGSAQKAGLHQISEIDPQLWNKIIDRVSGVNFGAIYRRATLLGNIQSYKPNNISWQQYSVFLLESIGLYEPRIMQRYYNKIKYYMKWSEVHENIPYGQMPDESVGRAISWKKVARALEKNDFYLTQLDYGYDKAGDKLLLELKNKHKLSGEGYIPPVLKRSITKLGNDDGNNDGNS